MIIILVIILIFIILFTNDNIKETFSNDYILPKNIYTYWRNIKDEKIINAHIDTWRQNIKNWNIIVIDDNNLKDYVSQEFIEKYKNLDVVRYSDFIRLELLKTNGGVWLDGGIIVTNGQFLDTYYEEMIQNSYDICLYEYSDRSTETTQYLENWFFMAPKNSKFINDLYNQFDTAYKMGFLEYKQQILIPSNIDLKYTLQWNEKTYLMQHAIIHYLLQKGNEYKMNIKDAKTSMFKIQRDHDWDHARVVYFLENNTNWDDYYAIKMIRPTRHFITDEYKYIRNISNLSTRPHFHNR